MGVVNYDTVDGVILGDSVHGTYMRDALGSVTGTIPNKVVANTYRYKPYGERMAKTGTAPDPSFQWNGTSGYRQTSISHSASYVRRRHLGLEEGRWTTVDPLWPIQASYTYVNNSPGSVFDFSGKAPWDKCGFLYWLRWGCSIDRTKFCIEHCVKQNLIPFGCFKFAMSCTERCLCLTLWPEPGQLPPGSREIPDNPNQTCDDCTLDDLMKRQDEACNPPHSCKAFLAYPPNPSRCNEIHRRIGQFLKCIHARANVMNICWGGGNAGHMKNIRDELTGRKKCKDALKFNNCPGA